MFMLKLRPSEALHAFCTQCLGLQKWNRALIEECQGDQAACGPCPFYPYRLGTRAPIKIFRKFCLDCMGNDKKLITECPTSTCPIYPYRYGTNPALKGKRKAPKEGVDALRKYHQEPRDDLKTDQISSFPCGYDGRPSKGERGSVLMEKGVSYTR